MEILCFLAGMVFFFTHSTYAFLWLSVCLFFSRNYLLLLWFAMALVWASFHQYWLADQGMPQTAVIQKAVLSGQVSSIPSISSDKTVFQFTLDHLEHKPVKALILLSCYQHCPVFRVGEFWSLEAKLKGPKDLGNPGHFAFQEHLSARHIHWTGYLKTGTAKKQKREPKGLWERTQMAVLAQRERTASSLGLSIADRDARGIVEALTLGIGNHIEKPLWDLFRRTGTTHLMVISGAHISLVAGMAYWTIRKLWVAFFPHLCLYLPASMAAGIGALILVFAYALMAGFAIPAQRAFVACVLALICPFLNRRFTGWQSWRYALFGVLILEPHAVLLPGFYLSFLAVATLIATSQRLSTTQGLKKAFYLQMACLLGLMPLTLYWFSYAALTGMAANMLAIPMVGYLLVPLSLLTVLLNSFFNQPPSLLFLPLIKLIHLLLSYLHTIDSFSFINMELNLSDATSLLAMFLGFVLFFLLPLRASFPLAVVLLLSAFLPKIPQIKNGQAEINVLDVGQGLSVVVRTAKHTLIYDTGVQFFQGGDMGAMAIVPYLKALKINTIDRVIISHPDLDHRGGLPSLEQSYPIKSLLVDKVSFYHRGASCHTFPAWEWDGVFFRFFPIKALFRDKNNSSCVLQISTQGGRVLLTGDIEELAENYLVNTYREALASEVLLVAHHGSKTSSTKAFIREVHPKFAIISAGLDNRYHFPHQKTLETLAAANIRLLNTMDCGMVSITLRSQAPIQEPGCYWKDKKLYKN